MRILATSVAVFMFLSSLGAITKNIEESKTKVQFLSKGNDACHRGPRGHRGKKGHHGKKGKRGRKGQEGSVGPAGPMGATGVLSTAYISSYNSADQAITNTSITPLDFPSDQPGTPTGGILHGAPTTDFFLPGGVYLVTWNLSATAVGADNSIRIRLFSNLFGVYPPSPNSEASLPTSVKVPISGQIIVTIPSGGDTLSLLVNETIATVGGITISLPMISFTKISN